ncbi:MAG TPA: hypothetical protein VJT74_17560, partial [Pyrinomonadaceae bacterium]|nr:hypothetical protein [Pyrinomonadaceae bacterium]
RVFIVSPADTQVEGDELLFHKLNSTPLLSSAFLLLIRIIHHSAFIISSLPLALDLPNSP